MRECRRGRAYFSSGGARAGRMGRRVVQQPRAGRFRSTLDDGGYLLDVLPRWIERCGSWVGRLWQRAAGALSRAPREVLDEDIREVFLAELDELNVTLVSLLPVLRSNPGEPTTLQSLRRAFHTLKGSGLMAGAPSLAGVCGSLERLAVRLVERRISATPEVLALFEQAIKLLPECRRSIAAGAPLPMAMRAVGQRAERLLGGS